jgi:hypothetical protein
LPFPSRRRRYRGLRHRRRWWPPKTTIQQAEGFALAITKMAFTGELKDVMDTVAANWRQL